MPALAQVAEKTGPPSSSSNQDQSDRNKRERWPEWLKLGAELRGRAESSTSLDSDYGGLYLNRLRLDAAVQPLPWLRLFIQEQDARAVSLGGRSDPAGLRDPFELHQAYLDLGRPEAGWQLRIGRQALAFGDERLVGADNDWDPLGQTFDAVRVDFAGTRFHAAAFAGFRVLQAVRGLDPFDTASRISGLSFEFKTRGSGTLEPYFFWKRGGDTVDLMQNLGHRDVLTPGIRAQGALPQGLDYNVEMALQRGHVVGEAISAWAGHWELGWKPLGDNVGLRLGLEYNFASGDRKTADQRYGTFDDLYPAGFNKYGMADPIAWRNIRYPSLGAELPVTRHWTLYGCYRHYWLASVQDGLYPGGDEYIVKNPAAGTDVGGQALVSMEYIVSKHWRLYAGYGYLLPGGFLRQSGYAEARQTAYWSRVLPSDPCLGNYPDPLDPSCRPECNALSG